MQKYVHLRKGLSNYGKLVPLEDIKDKDKLKKYIKSAPKKDWYISLFYFDEEANKYFVKNKGSIKGYKGEALCNKLVFDLDSSDISKAQQDAITLLNRLQDEGIDVANYTRVFFSGNKGFHIEVPIEKSFKPKELKCICSNLAKGLDTFDTSIYNTTRAFRLRDTINPKSGLYKIEIAPDDLLNLGVEEIKEKAKKPSAVAFEVFTVKDLKFLDKYKNEPQKNKSVVVDVEEIDGVRGLETIDFNKMPKHTPRCVYALEHGIMVPGIGERSEIFLRLAAYYRNQGDSKEKAHNALKAVARLNSRLYPESEPFSKEEIYNTSVNSAYSDTWKQVPGASGIDLENPIFKKYCDIVGKHTHRKCTLHSKEEKRNTIIQIDEAFDSFSRFAENFEKNTVKTGIQFIDDYVKLMSGTTSMLAGCSGSGKTTLGLNIVENANKLDQHCVFFSMDTHKNMLSLKLAQKLTNYSQDEILKIFQNKDRKKVDEIRNAMKLAYGNTYFDFSSTLTFQQMRDKVEDVEQRTGNKVRLVFVDYVGRIISDKGDSFANASYNALKSVEIAADTDASWLLVSQISRASGDGLAPLRSKRVAKDSSSWEESASSLLTCWRPFMGSELFNNPLWNDDIMRIAVVKNRMGPELERPLHWNGSKGIIKDLSNVELQDYVTVREPEEKEYYKARFSRD